MRRKNPEERPGQLDQEVANPFRQVSASCQGTYVMPKKTSSISSTKKPLFVLSKVEKAIILWLCFSGAVHILIEGTWALWIGPEPLKNADPSLNFWLTPCIHILIFCDLIDHSHTSFSSHALRAEGVHNSPQICC